MTENEILQENLRSLSLPSELGVLRVEADPDALDYLDYQSTVDVLVTFADGKEYFSIVSYNFLSKLVSKLRAEGKKVYTVGKPLLIVSEITAETILEALQRHLLQEDASYEGSFSRPAVPRFRA